MCIYIYMYSIYLTPKVAMWEPLAALGPRYSEPEIRALKSEARLPYFVKG